MRCRNVTSRIVSSLNKCIKNSAGISTTNSYATEVPESRRTIPKRDIPILIWGEDRSKFGAPESKYRDANLCVTGKISIYRSTPEIVATEPNQIAEVTAFTVGCT